MRRGPFTLETTEMFGAIPKWKFLPGKTGRWLCLPPLKTIPLTPLVRRWRLLRIEKLIWISSEDKGLGNVFEGRWSRYLIKKIRHSAMCQYTEIALLQTSYQYIECPDRSVCFNFYNFLFLWIVSDSQLTINNRILQNAKLSLSKTMKTKIS